MGTMELKWRPRTATRPASRRPAQSISSESELQFPLRFGEHVSSSAWKFKFKFKFNAVDVDSQFRRTPRHILYGSSILLRKHPQLDALNPVYNYLF